MDDRDKLFTEYFASRASSFRATAVLDAYTRQILVRTFQRAAPAQEVVHEQDFKLALRDSVAVVTAPPPMSETEALDAAKRAVRRRRATWASGASAFAVVAFAAGVAFVAPGADRPVQRAGADVTPTNPPPSAATEPDWPDGQTDATATSGPRYNRGVTLLDKLTDVVPAGFESPNLTGKPGSDLPGTPLYWHQAAWNYEDDSWTYDAALPVAKVDGVGRLAVVVRTPEMTLPARNRRRVS